MSTPSALTTSTTAFGLPRQVGGRLCQPRLIGPCLGGHHDALHHTPPGCPGPGLPRPGRPLSSVGPCLPSSSTPCTRPTADQPKAIDGLVEGIESGARGVTLLGATGTGKTMTMAATIERLQRPALVLAHNKTLAAQLCNEFRTYFPSNAVEYFVSYYDYYQPEAYVPSKDLYIEKDSAINQEIDRLRHAATAALFARRDVVIVGSVSAIFGLGSPETYNDNCQILLKGGDVDRDELLRKLVYLQYNRNDTALGRGTFRVRGDTLEVFPAYAETAFRALLFGDEVERLQHFDPADRRADRRRPGARRDLAGDALQRQGGHDGARGRGDRPRAQPPHCSSSRRRASCSSRTACASARSTTWRCCARSGSAPGSRTTPGSSTAGRRARARTA